MNVCKYCKKYGVCSIMTKLGLITKHIVFFIKALFSIFFKENLLLNTTVTILFFITIKINSSIGYLECINLLYGSYLGILVTMNLQLATEQYRKEIIWDGDWKIIEYEKYNFEHKKDIYICLSGCLSDIIAMIVNYFGEPYREGRLMSLEHFNNASRRYSLWRLEQFHPDFNRIDELNSYNAFMDYVRVFRKIDAIIFAMQNIQTHLNSYCPQFNVKCTIGLLLNELFITSSNVKDLQIFIEESSPNDDAIIWKIRLKELLEQHQINIDALNNNVRNLVIQLSLMYNDINKDYDFSKIKENK